MFPRHELCSIYVMFVLWQTGNGSCCIVS
uniref:Uncharacterized protein n=1 Tax=Arundo donax TaxID=35708 RepID=A0A0A9HPA6_ARUDO